MMRILRGAGPAIVACWLMLPSLAAAQTASASDAPAAVQAVTLFELILRDGSKLYGSVDREDDDEIVFRTHAGTVIHVRRDDVRTLRRISGRLLNGEFQRLDPNKTRLLFGPTGESLAKGQTYLGVYEFMMPFVQVGVTDRFSIGGGTPLTFGFDDLDRPFWITPKFQVIRKPQTKVAVGLMQVFAGGGDGGGVAYAVGTHGGPAGSYTVGAGVGYANGGGHGGVVMLGGERQVRRNMKVITETYLWKGGYGVTTAGIRFFGGRLSADLGLGIPIGASEAFAVPIVNFVYVF